MPTLSTQWVQLTYNEKKGLFDICDKSTGSKLMINAFASFILIKQDGKELKLSSPEASEKQYEVKSNLDDKGKYTSLIAKFRFKNGLLFTLSIILYEETPHIIFQTSIKSSQNGYLIKAFYPLIVSREYQGIFQLGSIQDWRLFRQDWQSWSRVEVISLDKRLKRPWMKLPQRVMYSTKEKFRKGQFLSDNFAVIKNLKTQKFLTLGFISMKNHLTQIGLHVNYEKDEFKYIFAQSLVGGIELPPNTEVFSEKLVLIMNGMDALDSLDYYANLTRAEMKARTWDPIPTGWCSWYYYYSRVSEDAILQNSEFLTHHKDIPVEYIQLDDGYLPKKRFNVKIGDWLETNDRFPHGLGWLAKEIIADGFKPGLWLAPFLVSKSSKIYQEHPDWVIREKNGNPMEVEINPEWGLFNKFYGLDCTHPEVQEWLHTLFKTITEEWGYKFIKIDFIFAAAVDGVFHDPSMTRIQAYRKGLEIIRDAIGDDVFILGCGAPLGPSIGLVDGIRIGVDTYYAFSQPFLYWFLNKFFFAGLEGVPAMEDALRSVVLRSFMHNKFWINDPDCLLVRRTRSNLKPHEIEFEVTLMGLCGGLLISSDNLPELAPQDLNYIKFLLPPSKTPAIPLDLFENSPPMYLKYEITSSHFSTPFYLVGIFNWTKKTKSILISIERFQLDPNLTYHIFDFWEKKYFQIRKDHAKIKELKGHSVKFLVIRPTKQEPQFIASTFHFSQGAIEITKYEFNPETNEVSLEIKKPGRNKGQLYLYLPSSFQETELISESPCDMARNEDDLLVINIRFENSANITLKLKS